MRRADPFFAVMIAVIASFASAADAAAPPAAAASAAAPVNEPPANEPPARAADRQTATRIPEPDTVALFVLGASGLLIGRRLSHSNRRRAPDA